MAKTHMSTMELSREQKALLAKAPKDWGPLPKGDLSPLNSLVKAGLVEFDFDTEKTWNVYKWRRKPTEESK